MDCGYSLEPPRRGGSNEYPQSMFRAEIWKNITVFVSENFKFLEEKFSIYLNRRVFVIRIFWENALLNEPMVWVLLVTLLFSDLWYIVYHGLCVLLAGVISRRGSVIVALFDIFYNSGPSCSKLTMSLVNDSLKFPSSDTQICWNFSWKNVSSFCTAKATHIFFQQKNIRILYIESANTVNEMTLNELVKLTTLWTTGPWTFENDILLFHSIIYRWCQ